MNIVNADIVEYDNLMGHCHNLWIQTLLESGILGLLLLLALHVYFLMHAFRLLKNKSLPFWQRLLPLPALAALVSEVFEHTASPDTCFPQLTLLYLFMGFTIAFGSRIKESSVSPK